MALTLMLWPMYLPKKNLLFRLVSIAIVAVLFLTSYQNAYTNASLKETSLKFRRIGKWVEKINLVVLCFMSKVSEKVLKLHGDSKKIESIPTREVDWNSKIRNKPQKSHTWDLDSQELMRTRQAYWQLYVIDVIREPRPFMSITLVWESHACSACWVKGTFEYIFSPM